jgi:hypothetical protein
MSNKDIAVPNLEFCRQEAKQLLKQLRLNHPDSATLIRRLHPAFINWRSNEIPVNGLHLRDAQLVIARRYGFPSWPAMKRQLSASVKAIDDKIVLRANDSESSALGASDPTTKVALPPVGAFLTSKHGLSWFVVGHGRFPTATAATIYADGHENLPVVYPANMSDRLFRFISETNRCTSKDIVFIDTMPAAHPNNIGEKVHYAVCSSNPDASFICLDIVNANETTFAHEIAHLWLNYVEGGDGMRSLREEAFDRVKFMQLNFVQSFVIDLKVNDLIAERGFDMSSINRDEIESLTILRDAVILGHQPRATRESLLNGLSIAGAILEQKRWTESDKHHLMELLAFFEDSTPEIYRLAQQLVRIVRQYGYGSKDAIRNVLNECITLAFEFTRDDFSIERDLVDKTTPEGMQDKYPEELPGYPVPLKLEIGKTLARNGINGRSKIVISASPTGMAQVTVECADGTMKGPLAVNYQLVPYHLQFNASPEPHNTPLINGLCPDGFGRLPGDPGYNTSYPPGMDPISQMTKGMVNGQVPDQYGRFPGEQYYNTCYPPGYVPGQPWPTVETNLNFPSPTVFHPMHSQQNPAIRADHPHNPGFPQNAHLMTFPDHTNGFLMGRYMAGVGLAIAQARLGRQMATLRNLDANVYQYVYNNPLSFVDPNGDIPERIGGNNHTGHKPPAPRACPAGWTQGRGSVTKCDQPGMGMKQMYCQNKAAKCQGTCCCDDLSGLVDDLYVAIKGSKLVCGATLQIMKLSTGETKTVTVIDEGPYANDAIIDISESVFGVPSASTWEVCVGPISQTTPVPGWRVCQSGSKCE